MKKCGKCLELKPFSEFSKNRSEKDGLQKKCKVCNKAYRAANAERIKAYLDKYQEENREKMRENSRNWHYANREKALAISKKRYAENTEECKRVNAEWQKNNRAHRSIYQGTQYIKHRERWLEKRREYYAANKEIFRARDRNRQAQEIGAEGTHTAAEIEGLYLAQAGKCAAPFCRAELVKSGPGKFHVDHMDPLSRGGSNGIENLQLLCPTCNRRKGASTMQEFLERVASIDRLVAA